MVLGAGPAGYSAAFRCADLGLETVLVERYSTLGGVCLNVGCIPSKALLHVAKVIEEAKHASKNGVYFAEPRIDLDEVRAGKEAVVAKLTGGLAGMAKQRKVTVVEGLAAFTDPHTLVARDRDGKPTTIKILIMRLSQRVLAQFNYHSFHMKIHVFGIQQMLLN